MAESDITTNLRAASASAGFVVQGVLSGFVLMAIPLLMIGIVIGLGQRLVRVPITRLGGIE